MSIGKKKKSSTMSLVVNDTNINTNTNGNSNSNNGSPSMQDLVVLNYKVGNNYMVNRLMILNNKIEFSWLNESFNAFKIKCKQLFLTMH